MIAAIVTSHENGGRVAFENGTTTKYMNPYTITPYNAPAA